ncbi:hypothetical protein ACFSMW_18280 [Virgibacillus halophilus]|uniref:Uncharacterized protein n=1 Tax=Tigheibacillus halophilus TaxID=361280 RepID=A0ABU5C8H0_9BACI|nr:hypothetical protein [Virgibacillus halophilus]
MFDALMLVTFTIIVTLSAYLVYKIPGLRYVMRLFVFVFILMYSIVVMGLIIFMFSIFGFMVIVFMGFNSKDLITYHGEQVNILLHQEQVLYLSVTFGVLYFIVYLMSNVLFALIRLRKGREELILLVNAFVVIKVYPLLIANLFPDIHVKPSAAYLMCLVVIAMYVKDRRSLHRGDNRRYSGSTYERMGSRASHVISYLRRKTG